MYSHIHHDACPRQSEVNGILVDHVHSHTQVVLLMMRSRMMRYCMLLMMAVVMRRRWGKRKK